MQIKIFLVAGSTNLRSERFDCWFVPQRPLVLQACVKPKEQEWFAAAFICVGGAHARSCHKREYCILLCFSNGEAEFCFAAGMHVQTVSWHYKYRKRDILWKAGAIFHSLLAKCVWECVPVVFRLIVLAWSFHCNVRGFVI